MFSKAPLKHIFNDRRMLSCLLAISILVTGFISFASQRIFAQAEVVYVADIKGEIDLGLAPYLKRVLRKADNDGATTVILDITTPGGRLDAALEMKNALLESRVPTIAFVNGEALSAGALIAIATGKIYMAPGAVLGAATPILGDSGEIAGEKTISAVRAAFASVAESRGLDPRIAEAMVDPDIEISGLVESGKLLTLTNTVAFELGYSRATVENMDSLLSNENLDTGTWTSISIGISERFVRFITNPIVSSMLVSLGSLGILFELQSPTFGISGLIGAILLIIFFWGHYVAGLAGLEGIILIGVGIVLLSLEVLVIPGFGIAGILGLVAFVVGLFLTMIGDLPSAGDYQRTLLVIVSAMAIILSGSIASFHFLPRRSLGGLVLQARLVGAMGEPRKRLTRRRTGQRGSRPEKSLNGTEGITVTPLRPAGIVMFGNLRVDAITEGGFIPEGARVIVVLDDGYRKVVRSLVPPGDEEGHGLDDDAQGPN